MIHTQIFIPSITVLLVTLTSSLQAETIRIGDFSQGDLSGWEEKSFAGNTRYQIADTTKGKVLRASSQGSASGLFKKVTIDLTKTPYLYWSWQIDNIFSGNNEQTKNGDDYPARVYIVVSGGLFFWRTRAINYVWSSNQTVGTSWPNAFTDNALMLAVRSGKDDDVGRWVQERRNVREDLRRLLGKEVTQIDAVAVMTDSDNTQQSVSAAYGDIYFSSE